MRGRPLSLLAVALAMVALDFRIVHVDLLPDAVGWLLVAAAAQRLSLRQPMVLGLVAAAASVPDAALSHHYDDLDPLTGEVVINGAGTGYDQRLAFDLITDVRAPLAILALLAGGAALWMLVGTLEQRAGALDDGTAATRLRVARLLLALGWVIPHVAVMAGQWLAGDGLDPVWNDRLELVALAGLAVAAVVAVGAVLNRNRGWTATDDERPTPWAQLLFHRAP